MAIWIWNKKLKLNIPDNWNQVSYSKAIQILELDDLKPSSLISILTGIDEKIIRQSASKKQIKALYDVFPYWSNFPVVDQPTMPYVIGFKNQAIAVKHDWSGAFDLGKVCTVGQIEDMLSIVRNSHSESMQDIDLFKIYPSLIAIYLQALYDKSEYDYERAMEMVNDVSEGLSIVVALNVGGFFLLNLHALTNGKSSGYQKRSLAMKSLRRAWSNFKKALDLQLRLTR